MHLMGWFNTRKDCAYLFWLNKMPAMQYNTFPLCWQMSTKQVASTWLHARDHKVFWLQSPVFTEQQFSPKLKFKMKGRSSCFGVKRDKEKRLQTPGAALAVRMNGFNINVPLLLKFGKKTKTNGCVQAPDLADISFCIIVFLFIIILHRLFLSSNVLKLARFWVPHTFDLHLEFCHLNAKEFLWTKKEPIWTKSVKYKHNM